jgi:hypothetical protein
MNISNLIKGGSSIGDLGSASVCIAKTMYEITKRVISIPISLAS